MSRLKRAHHGRKQFIDLAPMVDVTLTLVVFLLLNSEGLDVRTIPVHLPQAASADSKEHAVSLQITAQGSISLNGQNLEIDQLSEHFGQGSSVTIYADQDARHGRVTAVVDRLRAAGVEHIYYGVEAVDTW